MELEMDHSTAQYHQQEMSSQTLESMLVCNKAAQEKKPRPPDQQALKCPRCDSTNTKFCYYNNYSLTQPRYFCKSCRRYWTKGGTLRNVPVGGGFRKSNKRPSSSSSNSASPTSSSSSKRAHEHHQTLITSSSNPNPLLSSLTHLPNYHHESTTTDLSLAFARLQNQANAGQLGFDHDFLGNSSITPHGLDNFLGNNTSHHSFLDALRGGFLESSTTSNGFHNVYPFGDQMGNVENGGVLPLGLSNVREDQLGMNPYDRHDQDHLASSGAAKTAVTVTTVKQESCHAREVAGESRVLWGFPWQIGGDQGNVVEVDSGRQIGNWNGFGSTWHGLLNSPLM